MIYDDVKKELLTIFAHVKNARNAVRLRKDIGAAKKELATAYELAHRLMVFLKEQKTKYPALEKTYEKLGAAYSEIFDGWKKSLSGPEIEAICKTVEHTLSTESLNMDIIKKEKAAA
jgi:hypothetical protein